MKKHRPSSDTVNETLSVRYAELLLLRQEVERLETAQIPRRIQHFTK